MCSAATGPEVQLRTVTDDFIIHELFLYNSLKNDICLIKVSEPFEVFSGLFDNVGLALLPEEAAPAGTEDGNNKQSK